MLQLHHGPESQEMQIALFGGSFDPPHVAHQMACLYVLATQDIDEVWMIPCYQHPFDKRSAPFSHRVAMCRLAAALLGDRVRVSTVEEELGGHSYTLRTVKTLMARHPAHRFHILIGADLVRERERWYGWQELRELAPFLILGRAGADGDEGEAREGEQHEVTVQAGRTAKSRRRIDAVTSDASESPRDLRAVGGGSTGSARRGGTGTSPPGPLQHEQVLLPAISSTEVRARIGAGDPPAWLVPRSVLSYIEEHGLYKDERDRSRSHTPMTDNNGERDERDQ
jgi:nicotinate-nucleotide adenylyltransferase